MKVDIVRNHQVYISVAIVVAERSPRGPAAIGHTGPRGYIRKRAVAVVVVKNVAAETSDIEIGPAVIIVVAHRSAHGQAGLRQSGLLCHIGKRAVMVIVIER